MLGLLDEAQLARAKWAFVRAVSRAAASPALRTARQPWWHRLLLPGSGCAFEGIDQEGLRVVALAEEEARRLGHGRLGPQHLLLGLIWGAGAEGESWGWGLGLEKRVDSLGRSPMRGPARCSWLASELAGAAVQGVHKHKLPSGLPSPRR